MSGCKPSPDPEHDPLLAYLDIGLQGTDTASPAVPPTRAPLELRLRDLVARERKLRERLEASDAADKGTTDDDAPKPPLSSREVIFHGLLKDGENSWWLNLTSDRVPLENRVVIEREPDIAVRGGLDGTDDEPPDDDTPLSDPNLDALFDISFEDFLKGISTPPANVPISNPVSTADVPPSAPINAPVSVPISTALNFPANPPANVPTNPPTNVPANLPIIAPTNVPIIDPLITPLIDPIIDPIIDPTNISTITPINIPTFTPINNVTNDPDLAFTNALANALTNVLASALTYNPTEVRPSSNHLYLPSVNSQVILGTGIPTRKRPRISPSPDEEDSDEARQSVIRTLSRFPGVELDPLTLLSDSLLPYVVPLDLIDS
ncbi:hypothetical protein ABW19_dt0204112 [Dactylella cylindrospora]|nr:hypothetical protein ABW19_dt0204112 [Dactylella cylindrospora]